MTSPSTPAPGSGAGTPPSGLEPRTIASPPVAARRPKRDVFHGEQRTDDYFWLRERDNPDVRAYLEAENAWAERFLAPTKELQQKLYDEMLARIKQTDLSVPFRQRGYWYYTRTEEGKQYPIHCRKQGSLDAPEQIILDVNVLAEGQPFMALGAFSISDDNNLLAFSTDNTGYRQYRLRVRDLRTGIDLPDSVDKTISAVWAAGSHILFYTTEDHAKRPHRLWRHALGTDAKDDVLVYEEKDELFRISPSRSRSRAWLFLDIGSHTTSEVRVLPADRPDGEWRLIAPRLRDREYDVEHHGEIFFIRVNDTGRNFRLVTAPVADPREQNWTEVLPHRPEVMLEGVDCFARHLVVWEREDGLPHVRMRDLGTGESHRMSFPEPAYEAYPSTNREWDSTVLRFGYQSLITPEAIFDYDMDARSRVLLKQTEVLGGYDPARYASERLHAAAPDGVRVPISLVYRKGTARDGGAPMLLQGYGSYGYPYPIVFSSASLSLLDRGFVIALAHIRGGGELGKPWHDDGRMLKKRNTFTDFIAVAGHLLEEKYTAKDRLIIEGGSAGGLLMGAVANMRPDLFKAVLSQVPFVDVLNTMMDASLPLTIGEYEEWGNPHHREEYDVIRSYCPYSNLAAQAYPAMLVRTSFNDSQVMYWEPAKYVAKLRTLKTDSNPLLLVTNMGAGHGGASGRYDRLREVALDFAFMLAMVGIRE